MTGDAWWFGGFNKRALLMNDGNYVFWSLRKSTQSFGAENNHCDIFHFSLVINCAVL